MSVGLLILGLVLFVLLVVVHEFGHFIVARRNGVEIEEFGIFFPPALWSRHTKNGWKFSINLIPLGGFVKMKGERDSDTRPHTFGAASLWAKTKIMLAGVGMNVLAAFVLLTALAWLGMPQLVNNQYTVKSDTKVAKSEVLVGYIQPNSPAQKVGLTTSDQLLAIIPKYGQRVAITTADLLPNTTKQFAGQTAGVEFIHNKQVETKQITFLSKAAVAASQKTSNPKGYLGISPTQYTLQRSTWSAPITAAGFLGQVTALTFKGLATAVVGLVQGNTTKATAQVAGPVGIFELLKTGSLLGYQFVLMIVAIISLSLAIMNILPIPALDGGRLFVTLISRLAGKKLSETAEAAIYGTGFALLIVLVILITIVDVRRYF
jgi:regulator of sigma E protease